MDITLSDNQVKQLSSIEEFKVKLYKSYMKQLDLKKELDLANKKLEQIKNHVQTQQSIIKRQPSADRSIDDYILARLDTFLSIIGGE